MARFFAEKLAESGVDPRALRCIASVDLKRDEPCLIALSERYRLPFLTERRLPLWTHNKAIQKALESDRIPPERKAYLKTLKIKSDARGE